MSKIKLSKTKLCRALNVPASDKIKGSEAVNKRPGMHGAKMVRLTEYGRQLREKKLFSLFYNITDRCLSNVVDLAKAMFGSTTDNIVYLLESRLDAFVYRCNYARTIYSAKQLVSHGHVSVNGRRVDVRSFNLKEGDVVSINQSSRDTSIVVDGLTHKKHQVPVYIEILDDAYSAKFLRKPSFSEVPYEASKVDVKSVIKFYSR